MATPTTRIARESLLLALLAREGTIYVGPTIVQAKGAWSRMGPTWLVPGVGWVCYGPGVDKWGTTQGLAELSSADSAKPSMHAVGWSIAPDPNIVFPMVEAAVNARGKDFIAMVAEGAQLL